ncbi:alpha/beta hydrolase [Aliidongia dinghuensis]|uniref:Alpha/beta hydrolase n=1 Tax=Aliidongia dinghuensis TaxID=1867774 RepID=A0A8J2YVB6_9PROT|nr:alpha/beta hydrolase [Aliidongia dinghuensis]GGF27315.1 alpha/beta hydrolase [Aliidongia dinghuensis]
MTEFRERFVSAQDGAQLYLRDYGDPLAPRAPLLCLAGISRNSKDYHALALRHAGKRRVVCPDYRGRGRSARDPDWRNYAPPVILGDILQIMAALDLGRVVLVGTSFGGLLSMALNALKPGAAAGLVLNDIGPTVGNGSGNIIERIGRDHPQPDLAAAVRYLRTEFSHLSYRTDEEWLDFAERTYRRGGDGLWHHDWDPAIARPFVAGDTGGMDLWALFCGFARIPALVVRGGISDLLTAEGLARMVEAKPDLETVTVPGVGHTPHLGEPEVEGVLDEFLDRC